MSLHRWKELCQLPDYVCEGYRRAEIGELMHHIEEVFGYDISFLDGDEQQELLSIYLGHFYRSTSEQKMQPACRAFGDYVYNRGGPEVFGLNAGQFLDWCHA